MLRIIFRLHGIAHIPAVLPCGVLEADGDADGELVPVGCVTRQIIHLARAAVAVEDEQEGRILRQPLGTIETEYAILTIHLEAVARVFTGTRGKTADAQKQECKEISSDFHNLSNFMRGSHLACV